MTSTDTQDQFQVFEMRCSRCDWDWVASVEPDLCPVCHEVHVVVLEQRPSDRRLLWTYPASPGWRVHERSELLCEDVITDLEHWALVEHSNGDLTVEGVAADPLALTAEYPDYGFVGYLAPAQDGAE